jgi:DNA repair photolyase
MFPKERGVVGISTMTDPYQPAERRFQLTRFCLQVLLRHDWPVGVLTKSDLVVRDVDILEEFSECEVGFTVTTMDDHHRRLMEPGAPPVPRRLAAMRFLSDAGIRTYAFVGPVYPFTTSHHLRELLRQVHEAGASYVLVDRLNLRSGVWISMVDALRSDQGLLTVARSRLFPRAGGPDFYEGAFSVLREEARALGLQLDHA